MDIVLNSDNISESRDWNKNGNVFTPVRDVWCSYLCPFHVNREMCLLISSIGSLWYALEMSSLENIFGRYLPSKVWRSAIFLSRLGVSGSLWFNRRVSSTTRNLLCWATTHLGTLKYGGESSFEGSTRIHLFRIPSAIHLQSVETVKVSYGVINTKNMAAITQVSANSIQRDLKRISPAVMNQKNQRMVDLKKQLRR